MIKGILWLIGHFNWLSALVTAAVTIVETVGTYVNATGAEKKAKALDMLKTNIDQHVQLPGWIDNRLDALLGFMIDGVVWVMNSFFGKHWGNEATAAPAPAAAGAGVTAQAVSITPKPDALAQAKADFQAIVTKNASKGTAAPAPAPAPSTPTSPSPDTQDAQAAQAGAQQPTEQVAQQPAGAQGSYPTGTDAGGGSA